MQSSHRKRGYTLTEILITILMLGILVAFSMPKIMGSTDGEYRSRIKELFETIGETYMLRKLDTKGTRSYVVPYVYGPETIATGNGERRMLKIYLQEHLNYITFNDPGDDPSSDISTGCLTSGTAAPIFILPGGSEIYQICDSSTGGNHLELVVRAYKNATRYADFTVYIPANESRYTTAYGYGVGSCTDADKYLHICP